MKVSILVILIVLPMITSIGLYFYGFISTHWNSIDKNLIDQYNLTNKEKGSIQSNDNIQLEIQFTRHAFRSHYGLFGYCLDYKWLYLYTIKSQVNFQDELKANKKLFCQPCNQSLLICPETGCCVC